MMSIAYRPVRSGVFGSGRADVPARGSGHLLHRQPPHRAAQRVGWGKLPPVTDLGRLLDALMARRDISQSQLARRADVSQGIVSRLRSGERTPSRDLVETLADALDASPIDRARLLVTAGYVPQGYETEVLAFVQTLAMTRGEA